jgi:hypothetical protein
VRLPRLTAPATLLAMALLPACTQKVVFQTQKADGGGVAGTTGSGGSGGGRPVCPNGESASLDFRPDYSNVIVALDRSTSMNGAFGSRTKLQVAHDQLAKLVSLYEHSVRFAYAAFPGPGCFQDACCWVQPSPLSQHGYLSFVNALRACNTAGACPVSSERPTAQALRGCVEIFARNPQGDDHVVLISDGPPGCVLNNDVCRDATLEVQDLNFLSVMVHVVDLTTQGQDRCLVTLGDLGNNRYDNPGAAEEFEDRLDRLLHDIADDACRLEIMTPPLDLDYVTVLYKDQPIRRDWDRVNGWDFNNGRTITIYGNACDMIVKGGNWEEEVDLIEDCRPPSPLK